ncbi:hypothetical protein MSG28_015104 [Choristoneura fumiferana]|uniref:Uncharacterized protein n=1 Tax=Choristoneura fumiferana TaxID=7141 RepID=A0ACC0KZ74_CHOFU|nr:hypothetical protein MSG28_015104 [Choristoneura fumiferana]
MYNDAMTHNNLFLKLKITPYKVVGPCVRSARIATTILLANPAVKQQCLHSCVSAWRGSVSKGMPGGVGVEASALIIVALHLAHFGNSTGIEQVDLHVAWKSTLRFGMSLSNVLTATSIFSGGHNFFSGSGLGGQQIFFTGHSGLGHDAVELHEDAASLIIGTFPNASLRYFVITYLFSYALQYHPVEVVEEVAAPRQQYEAVPNVLVELMEHPVAILLSSRPVAMALHFMSRLPSCAMCSRFLICCRATNDGRHGYALQYHPVEVVEEVAAPRQQYEAVPNVLVELMEHPVAILLSSRPVAMALHFMSRLPSCAMCSRFLICCRATNDGRHGSGNGQATSLEEQITVGGEKSSSGDHEPEDEALAGLPPGGLTSVTLFTGPDYTDMEIPTRYFVYTPIQTGVKLTRASMGVSQNIMPSAGLSETLCAAAAAQEQARRSGAGRAIRGGRDSLMHLDAPALLFALPTLCGSDHRPRLKFAINTDENECIEFVYGGCDGNGNNFKTLDECEAACKN